ncbi:AhpC/TSA family antioxidant [Neisseria shayeganii 871]|uniref:AhpC/TSA family antioxidant n=2 Tax=Neisseria shayeganii TaxID=607712 RepID=G4CJT9_9NEIS|nr:AhpC/TSA family antioxidant [Neisseria shayeganii 871]
MMRKSIRIMACAVWLAAAAAAQGADLVEHRSNRSVSLDGGGKRIQVVNVWATWCVPCRKEMPLLSRWYGRQQPARVQMVGVALDNAANVSRFLQSTPVRYPIWRYTGGDSTAWMKQLGNPVGALPFTLVRVQGCRHQQPLLGEVDEAKLTQAVNEVAARCRV